MPARNPIGAATRNETRTMGCQSQIGCQLPHQRRTSTIPSPIAAKKSVIQAARIHPGPRSSRRAVPCWTGGAPWTSWWSAVVALTSSFSPLLAGLDQILDERVELRLRQVRERRHHVLRVARLRVGVRVRDRRADE